jgi:hypothetical protein
MPILAGGLLILSANERQSRFFLAGVLIGAAILTFAVSYFTEEPEAGAPALDDLDSIHVDYDLAGSPRVRR